MKGALAVVIACTALLLLLLKPITYDYAQPDHDLAPATLLQDDRRTPPQDDAEPELARLRRANQMLRRKLRARDAALSNLDTQQPTSPTAQTNATSFNQILLSAHSHWDWKSIATELLQPWTRITPKNLESAVRACHDNGTMYCQRMQIVDGRLYLTDYRAIFFDRKYAPARVMPLLETLRRNPGLPNLDIVVSGNDEPRFPAVPGEADRWDKMCERWPAGLRRDAAQPPATFSNTINRAVYDLPWPDFAWFFPRRQHKLRTAPWSILQPQLVAAGGRVPWGDKLEMAMHTGNVGSDTRKRLARVAEAQPGEVFVNELFIGDHGKIKQTCAELGLDKKGGYQQHKCYMKFEDQCRYKYLLNTASIGYANKFKSLLLCGSVVVYVREGMRHKEFYELGLLPGVHYVVADTVQDVPKVVKWLRANDDYARAVALAGRARMTALDVGAVTDFMAELLRAYAKRLVPRVVRPQPGAVQMDCEDDLWRHYMLSRGEFLDYKMEDNATCVHPPKAGEVLKAPGWGGAYKGSKPRCSAGHDLLPRAQPEACDFDKPFSTSESFAPWGEFPVPHPKSREGWGQF